jgi:hypothetical protein
MNYNSENKRPKTGYFTSCPRCGCYSFEHLATHRHCCNCLFFEPNFEDVSLTDAIKAEQFLKQLKLKKLEEKSAMKKSKSKKPKQNGDLDL